MWNLKDFKNSLFAKQQSIFIRVVNSLQIIICLFITTLLVAATLFSIIENRSLGESFWWVVVSATTTGYGDITPVSVAGRAISGFFLISWTYVFGPLIIGNFIIRITRDKHQFSDKEQKHMIECLHAIGKAGNAVLPPRPSDTEHGDVE